MTSRLPPQPGEWIDREQPLDFQFEGVSYQGYTGDVLSSALWANFTTAMSELGWS